MMCYNKSMNRKVLRARWLLILACAVMTCFCFMKLNQSYDPLARYQYATDKNWNVILKYLDEDDIDYMISQQIKPEEYMDFIKIDGFDIHYTKYYETAKETRDADNEYIVNFVNRYQANFTRDSLEKLLTNYTYQELTSFYEEEVSKQNNLHLIDDPTDMYTILDAEHSVYHYAPSDLTTVGSIQLRSEAASHLEKMEADYKKIFSKDLDVVSGYQSYETLANAYPSEQEAYGDLIDEIVLPPGQNEAQLGFTIELSGAQNWYELCVQNNNGGIVDYTAVEEQLTDEQKEEMIWLEENAYRYGFIIRYPSGTESDTNMLYQPFILRYVGIDEAKTMHSSHDCMETADLENE